LAAFPLQISRTSGPPFFVAIIAFIIVSFRVHRFCWSDYSEIADEKLAVISRMIFPFIVGIG